MVLRPTEYVETPSPGRLRYGLFTASEPMVLPDRARGSGLTYDVDYCSLAHYAIIECVTAIGSEDEKTFDTSQGQVDALPFAAYAGVLCGPVGYTTDEFREKARRALLAGEQHAVEQAVWTGLNGTGGDALGIDSFNNSAPTVLNPDDEENIASVVSALEHFAYFTRGYGYEAFIHAPVSVAAYAHELIVRDGNLLRTPFGSRWVFGGGYPGTAAGGSVPAGGTTLYVTGKTNVWRADDINIPDPAQTLDRTTNQQYVLAEREYAVAFDCLLGQAEFTFTGGS